MDPNACYNRMIDALAENDATEAYWGAFDLARWINRGGYATECGFTTRRSFLAFLAEVQASTFDQAD